VIAVPVRTEVLMGTLVTIHVVAPGSDEAIERAFGWFREIEALCTRFDENSELRRLCRHVGEPVPASTILFEAVSFALSVAEETGGAFDPTVRTPEPEPLEPLEPLEPVPSFRDIRLDARTRTIALLRPLTLDLGAVAKGLAVDEAARELAPFRDFAIDAGGDLYLGGHNEHGAPWSVGIRHPRIDRELIDRLLISDRAVCTSGDYERGDHILDPRVGDSPATCASVTVIAPTAMLADALGTAAFVLGPQAGLALFDRHGVEGLILTSALERYETAGLRGA
jgi:thiamine biosynthesis lipoprotein